MRTMSSGREFFDLIRAMSFERSSEERLSIRLVGPWVRQFMAIGCTSLPHRTPPRPIRPFLVGDGFKDAHKPACEKLIDARTVATPYVFTALPPPVFAFVIALICFTTLHHISQHARRAYFELITHAAEGKGDLDRYRGRSGRQSLQLSHDQFPSLASLDLGPMVASNRRR